MQIGLIPQFNQNPLAMSMLTLACTFMLSVCLLPSCMTVMVFTREFPNNSADSVQPLPPDTSLQFCGAFLWGHKAGPSGRNHGSGTEPSQTSLARSSHLTTWSCVRWNRKICKPDTRTAQNCARGSWVYNSRPLSNTVSPISLYSCRVKMV